MVGYFETLPELICAPQTQIVEVEEQEAETLVPPPRKPSWLVEQTIEPGDVINFVSWISPKGI